MYNFLDSKLSPKVICKSAATDNYEVDNLISHLYQHKIRGFLAYSASKPPVDIEFEFICPINIHYIILNTTVGSQRSTGIEIFAKNDKCNYTSICKSLYDQPGIVFCNSRKYSKTNLPENTSSSYHVAFFKSNTFKCFLSANFIKVQIFRTERSVPCLGSVEVWGTPSRYCSKITVDTINRIISKSLHTNEGSVGNPAEFKIPEDFKDDLTCEIMTIPMTLPSGKTIDQSTLDKHIQSEKTFCRKPCDPFTGIKFTDHLKPVMNVGLKSRIDMFLIKNSERQEFVNVKRTLGRSSTNRSEMPKRINTTSAGSVCDLGGTSSEDESLRKRIRASSNLETAINAAKNSPSFVMFSSAETSSNIGQCVKCSIELTSLYMLPCSHQYCRACMLKIRANLKCHSCDKDFDSKDVEKCNF